MLRIIFASLAVLLALSTAAAFEAASAAARALDMTASARASGSAAVRETLLARAEATVLQSWAQPAQWHAGAAEALSGIYLAQAEADRSRYDLSAAWAARAVQYSPVLPNAWTRLALLAEAGHANPVCDVDACLAQSWRSGLMLDAETACLRLRLTHRRGALAVDDPRIDAYLAAGVSPRTAGACLSFLPPEAIYAALMRHAQTRRR